MQLFHGNYLCCAGLSVPAVLEYRTPAFYKNSNTICGGSHVISE